MYDTSEIIDGKYRVDGLCSDTGGMGEILFVTALAADPGFRVVLKYCRDANEESLSRFRREVRLVASFKGNSKVVQIVDHNLDQDPPYFVMKYYPDGDLSRLGPKFRSSVTLQENYLLQMIDCVQELHSRNEFHRDIKPQNFLVENDQLLVSDFGLTTEIGSNTAFTRSSAYWGTPGFIPPEFLAGGFKHADAAGDIYMLGKTLYALLTDKSPMYLIPDDVSAPLFHIIDRCCSVAKTSRYQSLSELRQSVVAAYDVLLARAGGLGKVKQQLSAIYDRFEKAREFNAGELSEFVEQLGLLEERDQIQVCREVPDSLFPVMGVGLTQAPLARFLTVYERLVESQDYSWSYAETVAGNMRAIFNSESVLATEKAQALDLAIRSATYMNRFAAMNICTAMVKSVRDEMIGLRIASVLQAHKDTFIARIEPSECQSDSVRNMLRQLHQNQSGIN
jgi:serine/threonine protein kinase